MVIQKKEKLSLFFPKNEVRFTEYKEMQKAISKYRKLNLLNFVSEIFLNLFESELNLKGIHQLTFTYEKKGHAKIYMIDIIYTYRNSPVMAYIKVIDNICYNNLDEHEHLFK